MLSSYMALVCFILVANAVKNVQGEEHCLNVEDYNPDIESLAEAFDDYLFGQHLAHMTILGALHGHVTNPSPQKPLVLSMHGPTGTGKNHVSRLMVESLLTLGMKSKFVTIKMSTKDYPYRGRTFQYKEELVSLIKSKVSSCPHHIFIFDEVENMPVGLLDSVKAFLDYHESVDGIDFRKAIFIFRSNLAVTAINKYVRDRYENGVAREKITSLQMEKLIRNDIFSTPNAGFYKAKMIHSHLISHFIAFLPLEASHVRQCIQSEFYAKGRRPNTVLENEVLEQLEFDGPEGSTLFAVKGCKNVAERVNIILYKQVLKNRKFMHADL